MRTRIQPEIEVTILTDDTQQFTWHPGHNGDTKTLYSNGVAIGRLTYRYRSKRVASMDSLLTKKPKTK